MLCSFYLAACVQMHVLHTMRIVTCFVQFSFSSGLHCRRRCLGLPTPEQQLLISGLPPQYLCHTSPAPPPPPFLLTCHLPFMYQAEKLQSLTPEYNISLSSQQLADANALSSCAYLKNVGCKTPHTPHEQRCGLSLMMPAQSVVDFLSV